MEKILVMNGTSLLEFTLELMSSIYHVKNILIWSLVGCFFLWAGPLEDRSGPGKYQGSTSACLLQPDHSHATLRS